MTQGQLFSPGEEARLSRQCARILELLQAGEVDSGQLARVCNRYGARIFDLRRKGYQIKITRRDHEKGITWYSLKG